jgi:hypothetical protein
LIAAAKPPEGMVVTEEFFKKELGKDAEHLCTLPRSIYEP